LKIDQHNTYSFFFSCSDFLRLWLSACTSFDKFIYVLLWSISWFPLHFKY